MKSEERYELADILKADGIDIGASYHAANAILAAGYRRPQQVTTAQAVEAAEVVLIEHQRQSNGTCLCGYAELGQSHPAHQAAMLFAAGVPK